MKAIINKSIIVFLIALSFACGVDSNCNTQNVDFVTFSNFRVNDNLEEQDTTLLFDSITSPKANIILFASDSLSNFALPLSPVENQTEFLFYYNERTDTLRFSYEKRNAVDSPECGLDIQFIGLDTTYQTFDSLVIANDTLKRTGNAPNIKLYFL